MSSWAPYQRYRLALERQVLEQRMPGFSMANLSEDTTVEGWYTSSAGTDYYVVVAVPPGYPDECPSSYVTEPAPLYDCGGNALYALGNNHRMHVWESDRGTATRVCTFRPASWSAANSLEHVLQKTLLWIEAYEAHRVTGQPVANYLLDAPEP